MALRTIGVQVRAGTPLGIFLVIVRLGLRGEIAVVFGKAIAPKEPDVVVAA